MQTSHQRAAGLHTHYYRDEVVTALAGILPQVRLRAEDVALYALVIAFWGLIAYAALIYALP